MKRRDYNAIIALFFKKKAEVEIAIEAIERLDEMGYVDGPKTSVTLISKESIRAEIAERARAKREDVSSR